MRNIGLSDIASHINGKPRMLISCFLSSMSASPTSVFCPTFVFGLVEQVTTVVLYSNDKYVKSVAKEETR